HPACGGAVIARDGSKPLKSHLAAKCDSIDKAPAGRLQKQHQRRTAAVSSSFLDYVIKLEARLVGYDALKRDNAVTGKRAANDGPPALVRSDFLGWVQMRKLLAGALLRFQPSAVGARVRKDLLVPVTRPIQIERKADSLFVQHRDVVLRLLISLFCSLHVPARGFCIVLGNAQPLFEQNSEVEPRSRVPSFRQGQPYGKCGIKSPLV